MPRVFAISNPQFQYAMRLITGITNSKSASITTSFDHNYVSGLQVRIKVPRFWGMTQIDNLIGTITVTGSDTFTVDIDSSAFDTFAVPASFPWYIKGAPYVIPVTGTTENIKGNNNSIT